MAESNVKHFEDLPAKDILEFLSRPDNFKCTEKLDGSGIVVGRDKNGIYTRRANKEKHYSVDDYELAFYTNYQKLALAALLDQKSYIEQIIDMNEEVSAEVLIGHQPNVIEYYDNIDQVTVVLFKTIDDESMHHRSGRTGEVDCLAVKKNSYTESETKAVEYKTNIRTLDCYSHKLEITSSVYYFLVLLCSKQEISGIELPVYEVVDWPLNRRYPAKFKKPWKEVKEDFKAVRDNTRRLIADKKMILEPPKPDASYRHATIDEGYVFTNGEIEFKLVDQGVFLKFKNFVWKYRDQLKQARKAAGDIADLEQVNELRSKYLEIIDKYEAGLKDRVEFESKLGRTFVEERSRVVKARDRSAFVTAFEELSRIESEIRRNNRNTE